MADKKPAGRMELDELGILFVSGPIDHEASRAICQRIIELNVLQEVGCIQMIVNSCGGEWHAGFAVVDVMEWSRLPVYTTGMGLVASMALVLFIAGQKGRRVLMPHTSLLSHLFRASGEGTRHELVARRKQEDWMHERLVAHYLRHTSLKTEEEVNGQLLREVDTWLTPEEALALGLADRIQQSREILTPGTWREVA